MKKNKKHSNVFLTTSDDKFLFAFIHNYNGKHVAIPLPDFTLVHYDFAYQLNRGRKEMEDKLLAKYDLNGVFTEDLSHELYQYYGTATSVIINLFTSIESFMNHILPFDKEFVIVSKNKTEVYNRDQIQRQLPFNTKIKEVLPYFFGKNFFSKSTPANQHGI